MKMVMDEVGMDGAEEFESHSGRHDGSRECGAKIALRVAVRQNQPKINLFDFQPKFT